MSHLKLNHCRVLCADNVAPDQHTRVLHCPLICKLGFIDKSVDSVALRSDCVDVQADLELHIPLMARDKCRQWQEKFKTIFPWRAAYMYILHIDTYIYTYIHIGSIVPHGSVRVRLILSYTAGTYSHTPFMTSIIRSLSKQILIIVCLLILVIIYK